MYSLKTFADKRRLRNGIFYPISMSDSNFGTLVTRSEASALTFSAIFEIFNIWMPVPLYFSGVVDPPADRLPPLKVRDLRLELE
jgi:hypothetical protein